MDLNEDDVIQIIRYLDESNFNELRLQLGDLRIVVNKTGSVAPSPRSEPAEGLDDAFTTGLSASPSPPAPPPPVIEPSPVFQAGAASPTAETAPEVEEPAQGGQRVSITSPMLGTFYRAPVPGEPPFVEVGTVVDEDTTVCIIEVMKLFSTIKAEKRGRISRVSVEDGQLVEYGQVLFLLESESE